jgi:transcriptional regulator with XRE-family HTH domain
MPKQLSGNKHFGVLVRAAREEAELSGDALAKKIGMGHRFVWGLERGECSIQPDTLDALCKVLPRLEAHRDVAPKPLRLVKPKEPTRTAKPSPGVSIDQPIDSIVEFIRAAKKVGIEKAFELVKLIEVVKENA